MHRILLASCLAMLVPAASFAADGEISIERGAYVAITHGCHDCHTEGYVEAGIADPAHSLKGTAIGWRGPWGTTYPANLRLTADERTEDEFVKYMKEFKARPPMPYFNVNATVESDLRSLYRYIVSLGAPGAPVPEYVPPDETPKTPYYPLVPPVMP